MFSIRLVSFVVWILLPATICSAAEEGFVSLFNGRDLSGWQGDRELWSVQDGAITGVTRGPEHLEYNKFLIWDGEASDFELRCEFRLEGKNNSGVQYRSQHDKQRGDWVVVGYQADIHANAPYTGMLYDEKGRGILAKRGEQVVIAADGKKTVKPLGGEVKPVDLQEWHELTIIARGNRLIHKLDGVVTVDVTDHQKAEAEAKGVIAFQVHRGPSMKAQFRNVRLKKLQPGNRKSASKAPAKKAPAKKAPAKKTAAKKTPLPQWIWLTQDEMPAKKVYFRKEFDTSGMNRVRLYAVCDDVMTIFVDGQQMVSSDSWEKPVFVDLTKHLDLEAKQTKHVLAVECENGASAAGLVVKLDMESGSRDTRTVVTDRSWQSATRPVKGWKKLGFRPRWQSPQVVAPLGGGVWAGKVTLAKLQAAAPLREPTATPISELKVKPGFAVELLYSVPKGQQGSWVNMCVDPQGRLIVSDQYGALYRVTTSGADGKISVRRIPVDIGEAQGLLWAFDSLYVNVNKGKKYAGGLYRVRDTDGDGELDEVKLLRGLKGTGEHGPHAVLKHPDGKSLVVVCGNRTEPTEIDSSLVPQVWDEDGLLPRPQGRFMRGVRAPGGCIYRVDPTGENWELMANGFRNQFDAAYNADHELFTYDADMEWDLNLPWYRPTRVCHVASGAEFGWRSGGGKWPVYYPDSLPPTVNIGPGSPTGITFGYGAKFPAAYQHALFISDWSYGKMYALHLQPEGASYTAKVEEFITGTPLPLTDVVINPHDGAMYFLIGGRRVQSGLYRVRYRGDESTAEASGHQQRGAELRKLRNELEALHATDNPQAVDVAWPHLKHSDRFVRYAARVTLEHRPVGEWQARALAEQDPQASLTALLALVRQYPRTERGQEPDIDTPAPNFAEGVAEGDPERAKLRSAVLTALQQLNWQTLTTQQKIELLRVMGLTFLRLGPPTEGEREEILAAGKGLFPTPSYALNSELAEMLIYLQSPDAAKLVVGLLVESPTQEEQIDLAKSLRHLRVGWTLELRRQYFTWFARALGYRGGASFNTFLTRLRDEAVATLNDDEKVALGELLTQQPAGEVTAVSSTPRPFVKKWEMPELVAAIEGGLTGRDFARGRKMFGAANCFACHRFDNQGGSVGPDLTILSGRFSPRDILESIVEPSKQISDQYGSVQIITQDGKVVVGRIVNLAGDSYQVQTNMLDPGALVGVDRKQIEEMLPSKVSMMPAGLLDTLDREEILDLLAYLLSRGNPEHPMFRK